MARFSIDSRNRVVVVDIPATATDSAQVALSNGAVMSVLLDAVITRRDGSRVGFPKGEVALMAGREVVREERRAAARARARAKAKAGEGA